MRAVFVEQVVVAPAFRDSTQQWPRGRSVAGSNVVFDER
jgi:hypothetical protein